MRRFIYFIILYFAVEIQALEVDEPLSKQPWSYLGSLSKHYVLGRKEKPDAVYAILRSYINPNATILDLGSGTGISTRQMYKHGFKNIIGVDRDPLMIKEAQAANTKECCIKYIKADVGLGLPFADEQFDVVTATSSFHWFANPSSIREVARILKPEGYYFIVGGKTRDQQNRKADSLKENIDRILEEFGIAKPRKPIPPVADLLEAQNFKILVDTSVSYVNYYTKQEFLSRTQSLSTWNLVKESQRALLLKKIEQYLDTIVDEQGQVKREGSVTVVLAQKRKS